MQDYFNDTIKLIDKNKHARVPSDLYNEANKTNLKHKVEQTKNKSVQKYMDNLKPK